MVYRFTSIIHTEGKRTFIEIPFNVWEETALKGNIPCRIAIQECSFECKLIPKGSGRYFIPVSKACLSVLALKKEYEIEMAEMRRHDTPIGGSKVVNESLTGASSNRHNPGFLLFEEQKCVVALCLAPTF